MIDVDIWESTTFIVRTFENDARIVEFAPGIRIGIAPDLRVYWATPGGWDFILKHPEHFREATYRIWGDQRGWPTTHGSEFYLTDQ